MKPSLKFNRNGNFKIVQFTDLHEGPNVDDTIKLMNRILEYEKPDLVVLTGDIIDGKCKSAEDVKKAINYIAEPMEERNIPWAVIFGNHDDEHSMMSKKEMMELYMSYKWNISEVGYKPFNRIGNYNILIEGSKDETPIFNIYMIDSGANAPLFIPGYNWINCSQIRWYKRTASKLKRKYKKVIPSLMFFHIPLQEFWKAWMDGIISGKRLENECCSIINSGLFNALVKTGDVKGVFVGHDHLNNYCASLKGIKLGYGGHTGYGGYGRADVPHCARVFLINESEPNRFITWIKE